MMLYILRRVNIYNYLKNKISIVFEIGISCKASYNIIESVYLH